MDRDAEADYYPNLPHEVHRRELFDKNQIVMSGFPGFPVCWFGSEWPSPAPVAFLPGVPDVPRAPTLASIMPALGISPSSWTGFVNPERFCWKWQSRWGPLLVTAGGMRQRWPAALPSTFSQIKK